MQINQILTYEWLNLTGPGDIWAGRLASVNSDNFTVELIMKPTVQLIHIGNRADYRTTAIHG